MTEMADAHQLPVHRGETPPRGAGPGPATEIGAGGDPAQPVRGTVRIAPAVLIELIELTVRDMPGVLGFRSRRWGERAGSPGSLPEGAAAYEAGGVRVRVVGDRIDADVSIVVARDANILDLGRAIQRRVGVAAGRMLGMTVAEVNVFVAGIGDGDGREG
jgi:uncharacterized alkaline shock family protein YloU